MRHIHFQVWFLALSFPESDSSCGELGIDFLGSDGDPSLAYHLDLDDLALLLDIQEGPDGFHPLLALDTMYFASVFRVAVIIQVLLLEPIVV